MMQRTARTSANMTDEEIDLSDAVELDEQFFLNAEVRLPQRKQQVSVRLDAEVLDWFKKQGKGYQTRINAVLSAYVRAKKKADSNN